jgi:DNA uptake protein ComE-like DNA-binding protein
VTVIGRYDAARWNQIVRRMIDTHNAPIQAEDAGVMSKYLGEVLSPTTPALNLPLHINTASTDELKFLGLLPPEALHKIAEARAKGKIKDFAALQAIVGDKAIDKYKDVLVFD